MIMTAIFTQFIQNEQAMCAFGQQLMRTICSISATQPIVLYINGELGAGKTTLSRGMIQGLGYQGNVKSPTYTLVEEYNIASKNIYHFDLYRLSDPEELEFMGIRDYFGANCICLIEWAERGNGILNPADLFVNIHYHQQARQLELVANSNIGTQIIQQLNSSL